MAFKIDDAAWVAAIDHPLYQVAMSCCKLTETNMNVAEHNYSIIRRADYESQHAYEHSKFGYRADMHVAILEHSTTLNHWNATLKAIHQPRFTAASKAKKPRRSVTFVDTVATATAGPDATAPAVTRTAEPDATAPAVMPPSILADPSATAPAVTHSTVGHYNRGLSIRPVGTLSGAQSEDPRAFFQAQRSTMLLQSIDAAHPTAVIWFAQCFTGHARIWWQSISGNDQNSGGYYTIKELEAGYLKQFEAQSNEHRASLKFRTIKCSRDTEATSFTTQFNSLLAQMQPGTFSDEELRRQYFCALPDVYRNHMVVSVKSYTTTAESTGLHKMQDAVILLHQSFATAKSLSGDHSSAINEDKSSQRKGKWAKPQKGTPSKVGRPAVPPTACHFCPGEFHWQDKCPKRANGQAPPLREKQAKSGKPGKPFVKGTTPNYGKPNDMSKVKCYKCGNFGHYKQNCPVKGNGGAALNTLSLQLAKQGKILKKLSLSSLSGQEERATPGTRRGRKRSSSEINAFSPITSSDDEE